MADEVCKVCAEPSKAEIRANINPDTLLWKYLSDLQRPQRAGQWDERTDEWTETFR